MGRRLRVTPDTKKCWASHAHLHIVPTPSPARRGRVPGLAPVPRAVHKSDTRPSPAAEPGRRSMMPTIDRAVDHSLRNAVVIIFHLPRKNPF
jgi:hypothetical protein